MEQACVALTGDHRAVQRGREHRRQMRYVNDPGARSLFELLGFAGQRQKGATGLLAGDHLRHLFGGRRALEQVTGPKLSAIRRG